MPALPKDRDERLAQLIAKGQLSVAESFRQAGFNGRDYTSKLKQPIIKERIEELRAIRAKAISTVFKKEAETSQQVALRLGITPEKILQALWFNGQRCLRGQPVLDANGVQTGQYSGKPDASGANQAFKLLGMECFNMFAEKIEVGGPGDFSRMTDDELFRKVSEDAQALGLDPSVLEQLALPPPDDGTE